MNRHPRPYSEATANARHLPSPAWQPEGHWVIPTTCSGPHFGPHAVYSTQTFWRWQGRLVLLCTRGLQSQRGPGGRACLESSSCPSFNHKHRARSAPEPLGTFRARESRACLPGREGETREASGPSRLGSSATPGSSAAAFVGGEPSPPAFQAPTPRVSLGRPRDWTQGPSLRPDLCRCRAGGRAQAGPSPPPLQGLGSHADVRLHPEPARGCAQGAAAGPQDVARAGSGRRRASPGEAWFPGRTEAQPQLCSAARALPVPPTRRPPIGAPFVGGAVLRGATLRLAVSSPAPPSAPGRVRASGPPAAGPTSGPGYSAATRIGRRGRPSQLGNIRLRGSPVPEPCPPGAGRSRHTPVHPGSGDDPAPAPSRSHLAPRVPGTWQSRARLSLRNHVFGCSKVTELDVGWPARPSQPIRAAEPQAPSWWESAPPTKGPGTHSPSPP